MIQSISVNGEVHQIDYTTLANKPGDEFFLPSVTENDAGKVLAVDSSGEWQPESLDIPDPLPTVTSADQGKVLAVDSNGEWSAVDAPKELPTITSSIQGRALYANANGYWTPSVILTETAFRNLASSVSSIDTHLFLMLAADSTNVGQIAVVGENGNWEPSNVLQTLVSEISALKARVNALDNGGETPSSIQTSVSNNKLSLTGTNTTVTGEKLQVTGSEFSVSGEKMSIS